MTNPQRLDDMFAQAKEFAEKGERDIDRYRNSRNYGRLVGLLMLAGAATFSLSSIGYGCYQLYRFINM